MADDGGIETAITVIRELSSTMSLGLAGFLVYVYIVSKSLHTTSLKIFFLLGLAEMSKALVGIMKGGAFGGDNNYYCMAMGAMEVYAQSGCLGCLIVMAWSLHFDAIGASEVFIAKRVKFSFLFSLFLLPLLLTTL